MLETMTMRTTPALPRSGNETEVALLSTLLARALDEVDFGILLLAEDGEVLHMNHRARRTLFSEQGLQVVGNRLRTGDPRSLARLQHALFDAARRGLRRLLSLGQGDDRQLAALVPVQTGVAALLLGRTSVCEDLSIQCFARNHALTTAETRVLAALGRGVAPAEIAREQGVKISTVRTHDRARDGQAETMAAGAAAT